MRPGGQSPPGDAVAELDVRAAVLVDPRAKARAVGRRAVEGRHLDPADVVDTDLEPTPSPPGIGGLHVGQRVLRVSVKRWCGLAGPASAEQLATVSPWVARATLAWTTTVERSRAGAIAS